MTSTPFDWAARYRDRDTPWDLGGAHPELLARLADGRVAAPGRAFVPGCGRGHDALALAEAGFEVTAVDVVPALESLVAPALAARRGRFELADALAFDEGPFDLFFEHTFFSAIDFDARGVWAELVERVLAPNGRFLALCFPVDRPLEDGGPPWRTSPADLVDALGAGWSIIEDVAPIRAEQRRYGERWLELVRRSEA